MIIANYSFLTTKNIFISIASQFFFTNIKPKLKWKLRCLSFLTSVHFLNHSNSIFKLTLLWGEEYGKSNI
jgi:hypothetical protein